MNSRTPHDVANEPDRRSPGAGAIRPRYQSVIAQLAEKAGENLFQNVEVARRQDTVQPICPKLPFGGRIEAVECAKMHLLCSTRSSGMGHLHPDRRPIAWPAVAVYQNPASQGRRQRWIAQLQTRHAFKIASNRNKRHHARCNFPSKRRLRAATLLY